MLLLHLLLEFVESRVRDTGNSVAVGLGDLVVFTAGSVGNLLGKTRGDKFVLRVDAQEVEAGCGSELLGTGQDLVLEILAARLSVLRVLVGLGVEFLPLGHTEGNIGTSVRKHHANDLSDIAGALGVQSCQNGHLERIGQGRSTSARHLFQSVSSHGDRLRWRQQNIGAFSLEGNQTNLVTTLVGFHQETDSSTLCCIHSVQGHRSRRVDNENNQGTGLSGHLLDSDITGFDVNSSALVFGSDGTFASGLLVRSGSTEGGIDYKYKITKTNSIEKVVRLKNTRGTRHGGPNPWNTYLQVG